RDAERRADVARPQRIAAASVSTCVRVTLVDRVHGEGARAIAPSRLARARVELQERPAVARRAVTQAAALAQLSRLPRALAWRARAESVVGGPLAERRATRHEAGRAGAPRQQRPLVRAGRPPLRPVGLPADAGHGAQRGRDDPVPPPPALLVRQKMLAAQHG